MPVTKTAKRALRSSLRKKAINTKIITGLEVLSRIAGKTGKEKDIVKAISMVDIAAKKKVIHKNKASRLKSKLSKITSKKGKVEKPKKIAKKKPLKTQKK